MYILYLLFFMYLLLLKNDRPPICMNTTVTDATLDIYNIFILYYYDPIKNFQISAILKKRNPFVI